jgi:hypothetical protein
VSVETGQSGVGADRNLMVATILAVGLATAVGGYAIGASRGADLDGARLAGERDGAHVGGVQGSKRGYDAGFKAAKRQATRRSYRSSFQRSCRRIVASSNTTIAPADACRLP